MTEFFTFCFGRRCLEPIVRERRCTLVLQSNGNLPAPYLCNRIGCRNAAVPVWKRIRLRSTNCWGLVGRAYEINKKKSAEQIKFHKRLRPVFGDRVASLVWETHVEDYKVQRSEQSASLAIISRELACLRRAFNLAIEEELIEKVPRFSNSYRAGHAWRASWAWLNLLPSKALQELSAVVRTSTVK